MALVKVETTNDKIKRMLCKFCLFFRVEQDVIANWLDHLVISIIQINYKQILEL